MICRCAHRHLDAWLMMTAIWASVRAASLPECSILCMRAAKGTWSGVFPSCWAVSYSSCSADIAVMPLAA